MKRRIAIVGGGISGLTAAYVLERDHARRCEFVLYEAANRFGGVIETVQQEGFTIECGPDSWVSEKPWAEELARELDLEDELLPSNDHQRRTYIALGNGLVPLPDGMRMMVPTDLDAIRGSSLFSDGAKQAYLSEPGRASELRQASLLARGEDADESVADFVRRHFGNEVTEKVAGPLLAGVFGGDVEKLSSRSLLAPFVALEAEYGSLILGLEQKGRQQTGKPVFTTLRNGLQMLVNRLVASIPASSLRVSTAVR
ncbi:MAG: Protoporphyrinogen oxidase, aerobic, HemY, partial [Acidobacteriaceae bacterium]|nr:Protoporphyrinogen oxidase, aerobic, HemY [Acidobacteriaceae bacterium]